MDAWEETEAKIKSDSDAAVGSSSNKVRRCLCLLLPGNRVCLSSARCLFQDVASILKELQSVQKQLEGETLVFNTLYFQHLCNN